MNRFQPPRPYEFDEPLVCIVCEQLLTEEQTLRYWGDNPVGERDPVCCDCASHLDAHEFIEDRPRPKGHHLLSSGLFLLAVGVLLSGAIVPKMAGWCVGGMILCVNLGMMARVCRK